MPNITMFIARESMPVDKTLRVLIRSHTGLVARIRCSGHASADLYARN